VALKEWVGFEYKEQREKNIPVLETASKKG
jgi:hypothetical protein